MHEWRIEPREYERQVGTVLVNAAMRDQDLNATLHTIYRSFGDVRPTSEVLQLIAAGR